MEEDVAFPPKTSSSCNVASMAFVLQQNDNIPNRQSTSTGNPVMTCFGSITLPVTLLCISQTR